MIKPHEFVHNGKKYGLRVVNKDGTSHGGFKNSLEIGAKIEAPDWIENQECGNGIHFWPLGQCHEGKNISDPSLTWMVISYETCVDLDGKCKSPFVIVEFVGTQAECYGFLNPMRIAFCEADSGSASNSGDYGSESNSGHYGSASNSGYRGSASNSGHRGSASNSGYYGSASNSGNFGSASNSGVCGSASNSGNYGSASNSGDHGSASNSGHYGSASNSGNSGSASNSGNSGSASNSGDYGSASNSADCGSASNSGHHGSASNSGHHGSASNSGDYGSASNSGENGIASSTGIASKVYAKYGIACTTDKETILSGDIGACLLWHSIDFTHMHIVTKETANKKFKFNLDKNCMEECND